MNLDDCDTSLVEIELTRTLPPPEASCRPPEANDEAELEQVVQGVIRRLRHALDIEFSVMDTFTGEMLHQCSDQLQRDWQESLELANAVFLKGQAEIIADEDPFLVLVLPVPNRQRRSIVAIGTFITAPAQSFDSFSRSAEILGFSPDEALRWSADQTCWSADMLLRLGGLVVDHLDAEDRALQTQDEVCKISSGLLSSYEEINLLYAITQNLKISRNDTDLCTLSLERLSDVLPAEGFAIKLKPVAEETVCHEARTKTVLLTHGKWNIPEEEFDAFMEAVSREGLSEPIVLNPPVTDKETWPYPDVRQVISTPLMEGENVFGWVVAINQVEGAEFGTVEASLLGSVAAILGIHCGNTDLYRKQADFLAGVVRALTAAIDAKDPYTCGHSERVARISVRLAEELGCDSETCNTIYLSGLLHDIGKIGIDDNVLRNPGKLTKAEFEHIKLHPELGYKILSDLPQLGQVLPVVLHHHEAWSGAGYPHKLAGTTIPFLARIVAVADGFDAMSSDRPYRKGMPVDKIERILQGGSGDQWDARVIDAYFRAREDIRRIVDEDYTSINLDAIQWN